MSLQLQIVEGGVVPQPNIGLWNPSNGDHASDASDDVVDYPMLRLRHYAYRDPNSFGLYLECRVRSGQLRQHIRRD